MRNTSIKFVRVQCVIFFFCDKENEKDSCSCILITFIGDTHCSRPRISLDDGRQQKNGIKVDEEEISGLNSNTERTTNLKWLKLCSFRGCSVS